MALLGVSKVIVVIQSEDVLFEKFLRSYKHTGIEVGISHQEDVNGLGGAILSIESKVRGNFVVILGDDFTISKNIQSFADFFTVNGSLNTQAYVKEYSLNKIHQSCGISLGVNSRINDIVEKPMQSEFKYRGIGLYLLNNEIFKALKETTLVNNELRLTDALRKLSHAGLLLGYEIEGLNININTIDDLNDARSFMYKQFKGRSAIDPPYI